MIYNTTINKKSTHIIKNLQKITELTEQNNKQIKPMTTKMNCFCKKNLQHPRFVRKVGKGKFNKKLKDLKRQI